MGFLRDIALWIREQPDPGASVAQRAAQLATLMTSPDMAVRMRAEVAVRRMVFECAEPGLGAGDYDPEYVLAVIHAMAAHGDALMLPYLERLAGAKLRRPTWAHVREAARGALPVLRERIEQMDRREAEAQLLRPAEAPPGETLLRPSQAADADTLLRPGDMTTHQEIDLDKSL